ncbi:transcriptional regulator [Mycobacterium spongiae]|uniref:Transcriptional regulator n=2 Tax=Mycobacterium spongiae TaxID=886343 RepID=A0A975K1X6_9MYCO|nr:transcriptional regulator [Mycobacterium spongiae]
MVVLDVLGRKGALRILWELRHDPLRFRALQQACETNPGSLNTRLKELRDLGVVDHTEAGYHLTPKGRELGVLLTALYAWAEDWATP